MQQKLWNIHACTCAEQELRRSNDNCHCFHAIACDNSWNGNWRNDRKLHSIYTRSLTPLWAKIPSGESTIVTMEYFFPEWIKNQWCKQKRGFVWAMCDITWQCYCCRLRHLLFPPLCVSGRNWLNPSQSGCRQAGYKQILTLHHRIERFLKPNKKVRQKPVSVETIDAVNSIQNEYWYRYSVPSRNV